MWSKTYEARCGLRLPSWRGGGRAHLLLVAKFHVDADGTLRVHVDKFEVKPIGG
jgi:hypothetical protein